MPTRNVSHQSLEIKHPFLVCRLGSKSDLQREVTVRRTFRLLLRSNGAKTMMGHKSQRHRCLINGRF